MKFTVLSVGQSFISRTVIPENEKCSGIKLGGTYRITGLTETEVTILSTENSFKALQPIVLPVADALLVITGKELDPTVIDTFIIAKHKTTLDLIYINDTKTISAISDDYYIYRIQVDGYGVIVKDEFINANVGKLFYVCYNRFRWNTK